MTMSTTLGDLDAKLRAIVQKFGGEHQAPERVRLLMLAAGLLIWFSVVIGLSNRIDSAQAEGRAMQAEITRLGALVNDTSWTERFEQSAELRRKLERRFWDAATPGLAEAGFEAWLRDRFQSYGIDVQQVLIARTPLDVDSSVNPQLGKVERMTAKVISTFRPAGAINVAADIAEQEKIVYIDRLVIRTGRNARMESDVTTFTRVTE